MKLIIIFFLFWSVYTYSQMELDHQNATILFEIKKDTRGKYVKRSFKDLASGSVYEMEANPDKFSYEVREDVLQYLKKRTQKKFNIKDLHGAWTLKSVSDYSGKNFDQWINYEINETLEFNYLTHLFIKKPFSTNDSYTGCFAFDKKSGLLMTESISELSKILFPKNETDKLPKTCIKSEYNPIKDSFYLYKLDSDHMIIYMFIPINKDSEFYRTIFLNYIKVHY
ncbi:hypothetical protein Ga0061079_10180 [Apibacter mensalis]|uniref:Uncharacterized protein n=1 Tax=Apibacter mensalis TaxID=1586267 RepID=A0A0X3AN31_9FLAO|nr:hypothetical protein [Apibacter mensalis]CVK15268.1 hypothetical protein Ga0061079_10180 [Apibacter mensalis]